jgi:molybdopterin molybdotransferase
LKLLTVDTIEGAAQKLLEAIKGKTIPTEKISLQDACGRILAEDIISSQDQPAFNRSTVDGYAVKSSDTHLASESIPVFLTRVGEVEMGKTARHKISKGELQLFQAPCICSCIFQTAYMYKNYPFHPQKRNE